VGSYFEVGIDANGDGELRPVERRWADRHVEVVAKDFSPGGAMKIDNRVRDFQLILPPGPTNKLVNLVGRLVINGHETLSRPREVFFDNVPPEFEIIPVTSFSDRIEVGEPLELHIDAKDVSGIKEVRAVFDSQAIDPKATPWQVAAHSDNVWKVKLKTEELITGQQSIRVEVKDNVENKRIKHEVITLIPKVAQVVPKAEPEKNEDTAPQDVTNSVAVKTTYSRQPIAAEVTLRSAAGETIGPERTDGSGSYTFTSVPPGSYKVTASSVSPQGGYKRKGGKDVTVLAPPKPAASIAIELR
jgi:hypothetical protein